MTAADTRPTVVIAEDDEAIARLLEVALTDAGVRPVVVRNGALVVDAIASSGARLLVLDIQLPGASGIDVYDLLRNHERLGEIPVLFVTANPGRADDALPGGAPREVIPKPFDVDRLVGRVRALLAEGAPV